MPTNELSQTWNPIAAELRRELGDFTFHVSVDPLEPAGRTGNTLFVRAPDHIRSWVRERYTSMFSEAASRAHSVPMTIEIVDSDWQGAGDRSGLEPPPADDRAQLNPRYTFDQFVIGDGNRLAHAAALVVAEMPAQAYNPLFICGQPGLGKTHLLHAIGSYIQRYGDGLKVRYATADSFTSEFVEAVRHNRGGDFKTRFRDVDVLLLDDVQALETKTATREELFHTFNALYEAGSQIVLTSDSPPEDLAALEDRLRERFASGLVAEIQRPELIVRRAILHKRAVQDQLTGFDEETLDEIALSVSASVRSLEGALTKVVARASLLQLEPSPALARETLRIVREPETRPLALVRIQALTASTFGVSGSALLAYDRRSDVALARQVAIYLAREETDSSLAELGEFFGGRHHSTILHAHTKISRDLLKREDVRKAVADIRAQLV